jgi:hypothetical protein
MVRLIDEPPEIPGIMPREVLEIITRAVNADGRISDRDAARLSIAELCELEAMISLRLDAESTRDAN